MDAIVGFAVPVLSLAEQQELPRVQYRFADLFDPGATAFLVALQAAAIAFDGFGEAAYAGLQVACPLPRRATRAPQHAIGARADADAVEHLYAAIDMHVCRRRNLLDVGHDAGDRAHDSFETRQRFLWRTGAMPAIGREALGRRRQFDRGPGVASHGASRDRNRMTRHLECPGIERDHALRQAGWRRAGANRRNGRGDPRARQLESGRHPLHRQQREASTSCERCGISRPVRPQSLQQHLEEPGSFGVEQRPDPDGRPCQSRRQDMTRSRQGAADLTGQSLVEVVGGRDHDDIRCLAPGRSPCPQSLAQGCQRRAIRAGVDESYRRPRRRDGMARPPGIGGTIGRRRRSRCCVALGLELAQCVVNQLRRDASAQAGDDVVVAALAVEQRHDGRIDLAAQGVPAAFPEQRHLLRGNDVGSKMRFQAQCRHPGPFSEQVDRRATLGQHRVFLHSAPEEALARAIKIRIAHGRQLWDAFIRGERF